MNSSIPDVHDLDNSTSGNGVIERDASEARKKPETTRESAVSLIQNNDNNKDNNSPPHNDLAVEGRAPSSIADNSSCKKNIRSEFLEQRAPADCSGAAAIPPRLKKSDPENLRFKDQVRDYEPPRIISSRHIQVEEAVAVPVHSPDGARISGAASAEAQQVAVSVSDSMMMQSNAVLALVKEGFPVGLAQELVNTKASFPLHLWAVDNSGSMLASDCFRLVQAGPDGKMDATKCSRWHELQNTVSCHAHLAGILNTPTTFRLLNKPRAKGSPQEYTVNKESDVELTKAAMSSTQPEGVSSLTQCILEIRERIAAVEEDLVANGHRAVVVIATDGLPSDKYGESPKEVRKEFCNALKTLQILPVWIVIRLCTNEREVLNFYRKLDSQLELPLECIAPYLTEAKEVRRWNSWLNYALPLHLCREMGYHHRVFDLLDERELTKDELREFLDVLFGKSSLENAPDIHADWKGFVSCLAKAMSREGQQWCPQSRKLEDWIDLRKLNLIYGGGILGSIRRRAVDFKIPSLHS